MESKKRIKIILIAGTFCVVVAFVGSMLPGFRSNIDNHSFSLYFNPKYYFCLIKARTVKIGITRKEFERDFVLSNPGNCYLVKACGYELRSHGVCIDAKFRSLEKVGLDYNYFPSDSFVYAGAPQKRDDDVLILISGPFLQRYSCD